MDENLIKLVNKLQDTFSNLGARPTLACIALLSTDHSTSWVAFAGGELDMPQLVVVRRLRAIDAFCMPIELPVLCRLAANLQGNPVYSKSEPLLFPLLTCLSWPSS